MRVESSRSLDKSQLAFKPAIDEFLATATARVALRIASLAVFLS
jgi:hypothetical protein